MSPQKHLKISDGELGNIENRKLNETCDLANILRLMLEVEVKDFKIIYKEVKIINFDHPAACRFDFCNHMLKTNRLGSCCLRVIIRISYLFLINCNVEVQ